MQLFQIMQIALIVIIMIRMGGILLKKIDGDIINSIQLQMLVLIIKIITDDVIGVLYTEEMTSIYGLWLFCQPVLFVLIVFYFFCSISFEASRINKGKKIFYILSTAEFITMIGWMISYLYFLMHLKI